MEKMDTDVPGPQSSSSTVEGNPTDPPEYMVPHAVQSLQFTPVENTQEGLPLDVVFFPDSPCSSLSSSSEASTIYNLFNGVISNCEDELSFPTFDIPSFTWTGDESSNSSISDSPDSSEYPSSD